MPFTARQLEIVEILKSGVAFLESQPKKEKYSLRDVFTAAGDEIQSSNFYALIKQLKKKKANLELAELRQIFSRLNVRVAPLENSAESDQVDLGLVGDPIESQLIQIAPEPDYLVLDSCLDKGGIESKSLEAAAVKFESPTYDSQISSLSIILKTLAPLTRTMRMNVLEAAESFYGIGR